MQKAYTKYILSVLVTLLFFSCVREDGSSFFKPKRVAPPSVEDRVSILNAENLGRSSWQKPAFIVSKLGDIEGKKIADIGSGTGYFTFHLAYLKAKMIAIDIDPKLLAFINSYKPNLGADISPNIETRLAQPNNPLLSIGEIDKALIVNTIGYIENLEGYLKTLKPGLVKGGKLVIADYKGPDDHVPAPSDDKIVSLEKLIHDLESAGYVNIEIDNTTLKYQYVVTANTPK